MFALIVGFALFVVVLLYMWSYNRFVDRLLAYKRDQRSSDEAIADLRDIVFSLRFRSLYR